MARPKSIPWRERVSIFIDYRRSGKVQPTAKSHGVARSTVSAIVSEFEKEGFSKKPRANLPVATLRAMQDKHVEGLWQLLHGSDDQDQISVGRSHLGHCSVGTYQLPRYHDDSAMVAHE